MDEIHAAAERIGGLIRGTPLLGAAPAREQPEVAQGLLLKQVTGSFNPRRDQCRFGLTAGEAAARVVVFNLVQDLS